MWTEYNIVENSSRGLRIHVRFTARNLRDFPCQAAAYFYFASGEALIDINRQYSTTNGNVSVGESFVPPFDDTEYGDLTMFLPYSELHLRPGTHNLSFVVQLYVEETNALFATSEKTYFTINSG
jgi:hypothetical protein